jgi:alkylhydroperoxidase family enzyme
MTHSPVSRLPALSEPIDPILADLFNMIEARGAPVLNIHRTVGHAPKILRAQAAYAGALRGDSSLPRTLQVLIVLRTAQVNHSPYEPSVHRRVAIGLGLSADKLDALANWRASSQFDARERAALAFVDRVADDGEVDDALFAATRAQFSAQEIVEIAAITAWYVGNSRLVRALRIEPETAQT